MLICFVWPNRIVIWTQSLYIKLIIWGGEAVCNFKSPKSVLSVKKKWGTLQLNTSTILSQCKTNFKLRTRHKCIIGKIGK